MTRKRFGPSLYFYHDKAIYDGLCQHGMTKPELHRYLKRKGVFASQETEKEDIAFYLSASLFDYHDRQKLTESLSTKPKRENITSSAIKSTEDSKLDDEAVRQSLQKMSANINASPDCQAKVHSTKDGIFILDVTYKDHDLTKPEVRQIETKKAQIEVVKEADGYTVRSQANEYGENLLAVLKQSLVEETKEDLEIKELSLIGLNSLQISKFFNLLINNVDGYQLNDVSSVRLHHPDEEDGEAEASHIRKAMLNGKQVLVSKELKSLHDRGFHISSVQWISDDKLPNGDRVAFEASLKRPETKDGFAFQIRGLYRYSERTGDITQKLQPASNTEKRDIHKKLELSAELALETVCKNEG